MLTDLDIVKNCTNSILTSIEPYGITAKSKIKTVKQKPVRYFEDVDKSYGILSHYSSRYSKVSLETVPPVDMAYHVYSVASSFMLSTGARSSYAFFSIGAPLDKFENYIIKIQEGLQFAANLTNTRITGGDVYSSEQPSFDIILYGDSDKKTHLTKRTVKNGNFIYITGHPGDTFAGSTLFANEPKPLQYEKTLINRFLKPPVYSSSIENIIDELRPVFISTLNKSIVDTLKEIQNKVNPGFSLFYPSFPLSRELLQFCNGNRKEAFKTAITMEAPNELIIITNKAANISEYIDDAYLSLIGTITDSGYFLETHKAKNNFIPEKVETYAV